MQNNFTECHLFASKKILNYKRVKTNINLKMRKEDQTNCRINLKYYQLEGS
jgi:hypothetical protein